jgi:hypothetical protein
MTKNTRGQGVINNGPLLMSRQYFTTKSGKNLLIFFSVKLYPPRLLSENRPYARLAPRRPKSAFARSARSSCEVCAVNLRGHLLHRPSDDGRSSVVRDFWCSSREGVWIPWFTNKSIRKIFFEGQS